MMRRTIWSLVTLMLMMPGFAQAIQLHWYGGGTDLTATQATQAVLVVEADSSEATLPGSWQLLWTTDSLAVHFSAFDSLLACQVDTAKVEAIDFPQTPADSAANALTAHFCSFGTQSARVAYFLVEIAGGSMGKMKAIALNPSDSTQVVASNEVTFNGGVTGDYAPTLMSASYTHDAATLVIHATGSGLASLTNVEAAATDNSWTFPLTIVAQTDTTLTASATTVAAVPSCLLRASGMSGTATRTALAGEALEVPLTPLFTPATMTDPDGHFYPKDFAFVYTPGKIHIIYIRHNYGTLLAGPGLTISDNAQERNFGHQWTDNWQTWHFNALPRDTTVMSVSSGTWDNDHVWAPSIVQQGLTFYMFYTGVHIDAQLHQTQGTCLARSTDLDNWTRNTLPIWTCDSVGTWADKVQAGDPYYGQQQFRDPFVMPDPVHAGKWLMYFVTVLNGQYPNMVVGVARSRDSLGGRWSDIGPIVSTDAFHTYDPVAESPHVFNSKGRWWLFMTSRSGHPVSLEQITGAPVDTIPSDSTRWGPKYRLFNYLETYAQDTTSANTVAHWVASEHLQIGGREFIAGYDGNGIQIAQMHWLGTSPDNFNLEYPTAAVGDKPAASYDGTTVRLSVAGRSPAWGAAEFRVEAPAGERLRLVVYDVLGREVRVLLNGEHSLGLRSVQWDGRNASGARVGSGVYFAKLFTPLSERLARVPLIW